MSFLNLTCLDWVFWIPRKQVRCICFPRPIFGRLAACHNHPGMDPDRTTWDNYLCVGWIESLCHLDENGKKCISLFASYRFFIAMHESLSFAFTHKSRMEKLLLKLRENLSTRPCVHLSLKLQRSDALTNDGTTISKTVIKFPTITCQDQLFEVKGEHSIVKIKKLSILSQKRKKSLRSQPSCLSKKNTSF